MKELCKKAVEEIKDEYGTYTEEVLIEKMELIVREGMTDEEIRDSLIQVSLELTTDIEPNWQKIAARLYVEKLYDEVKKNRGLDSTKDLYKNFYGFVRELVDNKLYGKYILENYTEEDIKELEKVIKPERDFLFTYSGIKLLSGR